MIFDEIVTISDSAGTTFHLTISTPTKVRLGLELLRNGGFTTWRPHIWGGDWEVEDAGQIPAQKEKSGIGVPVATFRTDSVKYQTFGT